MSFVKRNINIKKIIVVVVACLTIVLFLNFNNKPKFDCADCNLILISVDTLRADSMGIYGYGKNTTPNIDKWAQDAYVFTNMRTVVPYTYPSFSALMTGVSAYDSKISDNPSCAPAGQEIEFTAIDPNTRTLAQILKDRGYITSSYVNSPVFQYATDINKGFDNAHVEQLVTKISSYKSEQTVMHGVQWLKDNKDKKFFLWIHMMEPHAAYTPPKKYECLFGEEFCDYIQKTGLQALNLEKKKILGCRQDTLPDTAISLHKTLYDGGVGAADELTGKILDTIKSLNIDKKTIVVFYGDHGEGADHNFYFNHGQALYDTSIKIPFIVKMPFSNGKKINNTLQNTQIFSTILDILKINNNSDRAVGQSFKSIFKEKYTSEEYRYYMAVGVPKYAIENGRYKYIYSVGPKSCNYNNQTDELYDFQNDSIEARNLAEVNPDMTKKLKSKLLEQLKKHGLGDGSISTENRTTHISYPSCQIQKLKSLGY